MKLPIIGLSLICIATANINTTNQASINHFKQSGMVQLNNKKIIGTCQVSGTLTGQSCALNQLLVYGDATLDDTTIQGSTQIYGYLQAKDSKFIGTIYIKGNQIDFHHVNANRVCVDSQQTPHVKVSGKSNIQVIEFTGKPGQVSDDGHQVKQIINHQ
ncbi:hypothetical protein N9Y17_01660 [Gammaproteobacteria bacterium]|nr:hypothetical protein [Gammaproteobacteria bacterium]